MYASRAFHWYKERHKPLRLDPSNRSLKFWEFIGTPSPKVRVALGVWGFIPSHFPTLLGVPDVTLGLPFGPHPCNPFALVASPKLGLRHDVTLVLVTLMLITMVLATLLVLIYYFFCYNCLFLFLCCLCFS
jgi:hypothetical protein